MHLSRRAVAFAATLTMSAGVVVALAMPASAVAPTPFPVYDNGGVLVTAHPVFSGERLVIKGRPVELASVAHPGPAFVAHALGVLPVSWKGKTLPAVAEG